MPSDSALPILLAVLATAAVLAVLAAVLLWRLWRSERLRADGMARDHADALVAARRESVERSRGALKGRLAEQVAPLLPGFPYLPSDARFIGDPLDYVVFRGRC